MVFYAEDNRRSLIWEYSDRLLAGVRRNVLAIAFSLTIAMQNSGTGSLAVRSRPVIVQYGLQPVYKRKRSAKNHRVFTGVRAESDIKTSL